MAVPQRQGCHLGAHPAPQGVWHARAACLPQHFLGCMPPTVLDRLSVCVCVYQSCLCVHATAASCLHTEQTVVPVVTQIEHFVADVRIVVLLWLTLSNACAVALLACRVSAPSLPSCWRWLNCVGRWLWRRRSRRGPAWRGGCRRRCRGKRPCCWPGRSGRWVLSSQPKG